MRLAIMAVSILLPAVASATPTGQFVSRWQAASQAAKAAAKTTTAEQALASPELKTLMDEFAAVAGNYRRQILDARVAGRPPRACPPAEVDLTVESILAQIPKLPPVWQTRDFADSFGAIMDKRYPCPSVNTSG